LRRIRPLLAGIACLAAAAGASPAPAGPALAPETVEAARALRDRALAGTRATEWVASLIDRAGPRLAGSPGHERAVAWGVETLRALKFANVRAEKVTVPVWKRDSESGEIVSPWPQRLVLTALGDSVATPENGIEGEIFEVHSLEELAGRGAEARGKIVFFDKKMERTADFHGYSTAVDVRGKGASAAARFGAIGVLIRSIGTDSNRLPHTGGLRYDEKLPKIPAAALAAPDADLVERLGKAGPVRVRFRLACGAQAPAESANVVAEVVGRTRPDEIVLLGAHLDSWDLGTGAIDDGAGCGIVIEAARLIAEAPRRPARTIRVVLYANEENGLAGGKGYAAAHASELPKHQAAIEADSGTGAPMALSWLAGPTAETFVGEVVPLLAPVGAGKSSPNGSGGADISTLRASGVPLFAVSQDLTTYFDFHHTANDTLDKIEPKNMDRNVAAVAAFAYAAADAPQSLERIPEARRPQPE